MVVVLVIVVIVITVVIVVLVFNNDNNRKSTAMTNIFTALRQPDNEIKYDNNNSIKQEKK